MHGALQLQAIRAERGASANEGSEAPLKPLVDVLREAKEAKEEAFQAVWRSMKTGASATLADLSASSCFVPDQEAPWGIGLSANFEKQGRLRLHLDLHART